MPAGDRTGPWGLKPRTGKGLGYCSGYRAPGFLFPGPSLGFGRGSQFGRSLSRGMGRGRGGWFGWPHWSYWAGWYPGFHLPNRFPFSPGKQEEEKDMLEEQAAILEKQLEQIRGRLKDLKKAGKEKTSEK
jgi:Family of unknown function (DUF5320)